MRNRNTALPQFLGNKNALLFTKMYVFSNIGFNILKNRVTDACFTHFLFTYLMPVLNGRRTAACMSRCWRPRWWWSGPHQPTGCTSRSCSTSVQKLDPYADLHQGVIFMEGIVYGYLNIWSIRDLQNELRNKVGARTLTFHTWPNVDKTNILSANNFLI
jgi:hypothetical protein